MSTAISPESVLKMTVKTTCKFLITVRFLDCLTVLHTELRMCSWTLSTSKLADPFSFSPSYCRLRLMFSVTPCRLSSCATRGCHVHRLQWLGPGPTLVLTHSLVSWSWHLVIWSSFLIRELRRSLPMFLNIQATWTTWDFASNRSQISICL